MKKFFQKLKRDCRGAVTVFVSLLLLPAVLVTGTGVDLSRMYAARSTLQDANQLAANSALASYDALLQDLYGLYGVMQSDSQLADMMDRYIRMTVFGEDWQNRGMGTFAHFYGDRSSLTVKVEAAKNLENAEVLRRQIEEYAKFRAPVVIVQEVLDKLDTFEKIQEDASVIKDKMDIDDKVEEIDKVYKKLYECINNVNQAEGLENNSVQSVNSFLSRVESTIDSLYEVRTNDYTQAALYGDEDKAADYERKYLGLFDNLHNLIVGGQIQEGYLMGGENSSGIYEMGSFTSQNRTGGLEPTAKKNAGKLKDFISNTSFEDDSLKELLRLAESADSKKAELSRMVDDLETKLNSGKCSEDLRKGMAETKNEKGETCLDAYRNLLKYDITPMAQAMKTHDEAQINATVALLENPTYGDPNLGWQGSLDMPHLKDLNVNKDGYQIKLIIENTARSKNGSPELEDKLAWLDAIQFKKHTVPKVSGRGFEKFQSSAFNSTHNQEFYGKLKEMYGTEKGNDDKKDDITKGLTQVAGKLQDRFTGLLEFEPLGAWNYTKGTDDGGSGSTSFGSDGDWGSSGELKSKTKSALNDSLLSRIAKAGSDAANKLLLLTYDSEMFSCYATNAGYSGTEQEAEDEPTEETMAGIPMGIKVNYYFQSELEYLFNGNLNSAKANLIAVTSMILLVRFVLDYTASFSIPEVNSTVQSVESALSILGPGAIVVGELVRLVMAVGESVFDVSRLKNGSTVALYKTKDTWTFSLSGILDLIEEGAADSVNVDSLMGAGGSSADDDDSDKTGLVYRDYIRLFLLLVDGDVLAQRTANLIELNVTNYKNKIGDNANRSARESAMSKAELFDMRKAVTDFSVTTSVVMKMLFLSSPAAQKGYVNGVVPPGSKELSVTDYRGY